MAKRKKQDDLDATSQGESVKGGNPSDDRQNLRNSYDNITGRDVPNVLHNATRGKVAVKPGRGVVIRP